eukprot:144132-Chlamydomonas_euryale.AAC.1
MSTCGTTGMSPASAATGRGQQGRSQQTTRDIFLGACAGPRHPRSAAARPGESRPWPGGSQRVRLSCRPSTGRRRTAGPQAGTLLGIRAQPRGKGLLHEQVEGGQRATLAHPCNAHARLRLHPVRVHAGPRVAQQQADPTQHTLRGARLCHDDEEEVAVHHVAGLGN